MRVRGARLSTEADSEGPECGSLGSKKVMLEWVASTYRDGDPAQAWIHAPSIEQKALIQGAQGAKGTNNQTWTLGWRVDRPWKGLGWGPCQ